MRRTLVLLAVLIATSLVGVQPSRAQFAECTDDYVNSFRALAPASGETFSWSPGQLDCHEFWRLPFETPAGTRWVRLIGDADAPPPRPEFREAADRATRLMANLVDYRVDNITMMLAPAAADYTRGHGGVLEGGDPAAWAVRTRIKNDYHACHVPLVFPASAPGSDIRFYLAHEFFHCVQQASVTREQFATYPNSAWWVEGSADLFGATAAGEFLAGHDRTGLFERDVGNRTPLYDMAYSAAIFFFWFDNEYGLRTLVPFLRQMANTAGDDAQMHAMSGALNPETWRRFAQAYDDRTIVHPSGAPLPWGDRIDGQTWGVHRDSALHSLELERFVIETGWADYSCGTWANELSSSNLEVRAENSTAWGPWPASFDTEASGATRLRLATLSSMADLELTFSAEKRASCRGCAVTRAIDRCVVGRWRQTGGGPAEYLRSHGVPITILNQTELVLTMNDDGTFSTNDISTDAEIEMPMPHGTLRSTGVGTTSAVSGRWSAQDGELLGCIDSGGEREGVTTFPESPEADRVSRELGRGPYINVHPWGGNLAGTSGGTTYTCSDTTLTTSSPTDRGPMEYSFARETPPPRRR